jgi:anaerobic ribonucleoside-triphosphate reductase
MTNGAEMLSNMSGLTTDEVKKIWAGVKENQTKLRACPKHRFEGGKVKIGQKVTCLNCGAETGLVSAGDYIAGYKAAGGNPNDIWPDYEGSCA